MADTARRIVSATVRTTWGSLTLRLRASLALRAWRGAQCAWRAREMTLLVIKKSDELEAAEKGSLAALRASDTLLELHRSKAHIAAAHLAAHWLSRKRRSELTLRVMLWWAAKSAAAHSTTLARAHATRRGCGQIAGARAIARWMEHKLAADAKQCLGRWCIQVWGFVRHEFAQASEDRAALKAAVEAVAGELHATKEALTQETALAAEERENWATMMQAMENELKDAAKAKGEELAAHIAARDRALEQAASQAEAESRRTATALLSAKRDVEAREADISEMQASIKELVQSIQSLTSEKEAAEAGAAAANEKVQEAFNLTEEAQARTTALELELENARSQIEAHAVQQGESREAVAQVTHFSLLLTAAIVAPS